MNRVLFITYPFPPTVSSGVFRTIRFLKYLPQCGWNPVVLTAARDAAAPVDASLNDYATYSLPVTATAEWPIERVGGRLKNALSLCFRSTRAKAAGANTLESDTWSVDSARSGLHRVLRKALLETPDAAIWWAMPSLVPALRLIAKHRPHVVLSTGPPHSSHILAVVLKLVTRIPTVLDFRDPWSRSPWRTTTLTPFERRLHDALEQWCIDHADAVILNTQGCYAEFVKVYGRRRSTKFHVVSNGIDPDLRAKVEAITHGGCHAHANGVFRICHPGSLYGRRTIAPVLEAIARLNTSGYKVQFSQIGRMDELVKAKTMSDRALMENFVYHGTMPHREALEVMASSDAFAVIQPDAPTQVPGKLYEMMLFKRPILALTDSGDTAEIVRRYKLGPVVPADDVTAIQKAIEAIMSSSGAETMSRWRVAQHDFDGLQLTRCLSRILQKAKR